MSLITVLSHHLTCDDYGIQFPQPYSADFCYECLECRVGEQIQSAHHCQYCDSEPALNTFTSMNTIAVEADFTSHLKLQILNGRLEKKLKEYEDLCRYSLVLYL